MWLEHNASPAQAALGANGPQTEKLGSHRPPDGFVVSHFALVAPLRLVGGPQRGSFSILNLFLLHSPSPLLPLFFFNLHFTPLSLIPLSRCLFLSFFFFELRISLCAWQAQTEKKKSARFLATHLDPSMSLSLSSFFILPIHFLSLCIYFAAQLAKKTSRTFSSLAWQPVKTKKYVHFTKLSHAAWDDISATCFPSSYNSTDEACIHNSLRSKQVWAMSWCFRDEPFK